ncbi:MAG: hypothetical protein QOJ98_1590, partial [Acidobacteriota bacterium]|nr:hypothetical protein [Acidobacteriota bacterium]
PRGIGYGAAVVAGNVIANNRDFGVALAGFAFTVVERNRIFDNVQGGIDIDLDGPDVDPPTGPNTPTPPMILSARFDGTATIIEGFAHFGSANNVVSWPVAVELYANTTVDGQGFAEGERLLGTATLDGSSFTLRHEGDLRGRWITGITRQRSSFYGGEYALETTSEFSRPVRVE